MIETYLQIQQLTSELIKLTTSIKYNPSDYEAGDGKINLSDKALEQLKTLAALDVLQTAINNSSQDLKDLLTKQMGQAGAELQNIPELEIQLKNIPESSHTRLDTKKIREELPQVVEQYSMTVNRTGYVKLLYGTDEKTEENTYD